MTQDQWTLGGRKIVKGSSLLGWPLGLCSGDQRSTPVFLDHCSERCYSDTTWQNLSLRYNIDCLRQTYYSVVTMTHKDTFCAGNVRMLR